jgi:hypothetical protein
MRSVRARRGGPHRGGPESGGFRTSLTRVIPGRVRTAQRSAPPPGSRRVLSIAGYAPRHTAGAMRSRHLTRWRARIRTDRRPVPRRPRRVPRTHPRSPSHPMTATGISPRIVTTTSNRGAVTCIKQQPRPGLRGDQTDGPSQTSGRRRPGETGTSRRAVIGPASDAIPAPPTPISVPLGWKLRISPTDMPMSSHPRGSRRPRVYVHADQGTGARPHRAGGRQAGPLPAADPLLAFLEAL